MKSILSFFGRSKALVVLVALLLVAQVYCELMLPSYTSDILNVGLQQNGIEDGVMSSVREESLFMLELCMDEEDVMLVEAAYSEPDENGIRNYLEDSDREAVNQALVVPEAILFAASNYSDTASFSEEQIMAALQSGAVTKEMIGEQIAPVKEKMSNMTDTYLNQIAVQYVLNEYEAIGIDIQKLQSDYLWSVGGLMLLMSVLAMGISVLVGFIASIVSAGIGRDLRRKTFEKVLSFSKAEINHFSTASLITRSTNDIQQIQMVCVMILRIVLFAPILAIGGIIMVLQTNTELAWIIVLAIALVAGAVLVLTKVAIPKFKIMQKLIDRVNLVSREIITGLLPIRAFCREKHEEERFDKANRDLLKTYLFTNRTMTFMMPVMMFIMNGVSILIVWFGAISIDSGTMQIGDMTAFLTYSMVIIMGFLMFAMIAVMLPRASVAADRIVEIQNTDLTLFDPDKARDEELSKTQGIVRFEHVNFRFPEADEYSLKDIDFTAKPGETTAIIGSTGCGKSTVLNLINRFYDVTEGSVSIDGIDVREITQNRLHELIGYVPQKGVLFSGTIESNLKYAGSCVSDQDMEDAASIAQAEDFIGHKELQYASPIAQGGSNVSGGQRQRLSIARAVAKHPRIFLFDDSFSALDFKTDLALRKALKKNTDGATVIIVAQRISTVLHAEQILVLDEGRLVGKGTHEELMKTCRVYQEIAKSQLSEKELEAKGGNA